MNDGKEGQRGHEKETILRKVLRTTGGHGRERKKYVESVARRRTEKIHEKLGEER